MRQRILFARLDEHFYWVFANTGKALSKKGSCSCSLRSRFSILHNRKASFPFQPKVSMRLFIFCRSSGKLQILKKGWRPVLTARFSTGALSSESYPNFNVPTPGLEMFEMSVGFRVAGDWCKTNLNLYCPHCPYPDTAVSLATPWACSNILGRSQP